MTEIRLYVGTLILCRCSLWTDYRRECFELREMRLKKKEMTWLDWRRKLWEWERMIGRGKKSRDNDERNRRQQQTWMEKSNEKRELVKMILREREKRKESLGEEKRKEERQWIGTEGQERRVSWRQTLLLVLLPRQSFWRFFLLLADLVSSSYCCLITREIEFQSDSIRRIDACKQGRCKYFTLLACSDATTRSSVV